MNTHNTNESIQKWCSTTAKRTSTLRSATIFCIFRSGRNINLLDVWKCKSNNEIGWCICCFVFEILIFCSWNNLTNVCWNKCILLASSFYYTLRYGQQQKKEIEKQPVQMAKNSPEKYNKEATKWCEIRIDETRHCTDPKWKKQQFVDKCSSNT